MTWSLVGSAGTAVQGASAAAITPTFGQTTTAGNLLVLMVAGISTTTGDDALPAAPSGWFIAKQIAAAGNCDCSLFFKTAAGSDGNPTVAGLTGQLLAGQLAEFHWSVAGLVPVPDQTSSAVGVAGATLTATNGTADAQAGDLVIVVGGVEYGTAATKTNTHAINNGATTNLIGNNNATSSREHYTFSWGITTGNSGATSDVFTIVTTTAAHEALVLASFQAVPATVAVSDSTSTSESLGFPNGPILFEPINTSENVVVALQGGAATLSVDVSDSTSTAENVAGLVTGTPPNLTLSVNSSTSTSENVQVNPPNSSPQVSVNDSASTSEWVVIAFDPPIIFTLEVDVEDSMSTSENPLATMQNMALDVSDTPHTTDTPNELLVSFVDASDSTGTSEHVAAQMQDMALDVSDTPHTADTPGAELDCFVHVADSTSMQDTPALQCPSPIDVSDSTSTSENVSVQLPTPGSFIVDVSDSTGTSESVAAQESSPTVDVSDSTGVSENVSVSLQLPGTMSINVSDSTATSEHVNCTLPGPLLVALSDSTQAGEAVGVQFPITGIFTPPRICDPTLATLVLYSSQAVIKAYASAATLLAYSSSATLKSYSSSQAVKSYSSSCAASTYTSKATPVTYTSFATINPYTSTATPKPCSP